MSVFKAQPPQITFPAHQATVAAAGIGTVPFQWISRSTSPASVLGTIYDLKIYELPDDVTDPNVSVLSGLLPVFNTPLYDGSTIVEVSFEFYSIFGNMSNLLVPSFPHQIAIF